MRHFLSMQMLDRRGLILQARKLMADVAALLPATSTSTGLQRVAQRVDQC